MTKKPNDEELSQYVRAVLSAAAARRVEQALQHWPELRERAAAMREEFELIEQVKDSFAIRLPETQEERIVADGLNRLGKRLRKSESPS